MCKERTVSKPLRDGFLLLQFSPSVYIVGALLYYSLCVLCTVHTHSGRLNLQQKKYITLPNTTN